MLLAEALALIFIHPETGRPPAAARHALHTCIPALLYAETQLDNRPEAPLLDTIEELGEKAGATPGEQLAAVQRGISKQLRHEPFELIANELVNNGTIARRAGGLLTRYDILQPATRTNLIAQLNAAATSTDSSTPMDERTLLLLSMIRNAHLLELVVLDRKARKQAHRRIDQAVTTSKFQPIIEAVQATLDGDGDTTALVVLAS